MNHQVHDDVENGASSHHILLFAYQRFA